jgi:ABC-type transport system involved in cytochrome c biogenesis permease subunit
MTKNTFILLAVLIGQFFLLCFTSYNSNSMKAGLTILGILGCLAIFIFSRRIFPNPKPIVSYFNAYIITYFVSVMSVVLLYEQFAKPALIAMTLMFGLWYVLTFYFFAKRQADTDRSNLKRLFNFNLSCLLVGLIFTTTVLIN